MNQDIKLNEMSNLTINQIVDTLGTSYSTLINNGADISLFPSVMLWGSMGLGKSQSVRQIAKKIEENTGKDVVVTDVRLLLFNPIDLRGIPVANEDKSLAIWLKPKIFNLNPSNKVVNILFLDEIGDMSLAAQAKVLRVLQEKKLSRVGSDKDIEVDVRVIAATNKDLKAEIEKGNFREDLYHRLSVIVVKVPSLDERRDDIPMLIEHFKQKYTEGGKPRSFSAEAVKLLREKHWPGNIRELDNVVDRLLILGDTEVSASNVKDYVL